MPGNIDFNNNKTEDDYYAILVRVKSLRMLDKNKATMRKSKTTYITPEMSPVSRHIFLLKLDFMDDAYEKATDGEINCFHGACQIICLQSFSQYLLVFLFVT